MKEFEFRSAIDFLSFTHFQNFLERYLKVIFCFKIIFGDCVVIYIIDCNL